MQTAATTMYNGWRVRFYSSRVWVTRLFVRFSTILIMLSASLILLVGEGLFAVAIATLGIIIGLESQVALKDNSTMALRGRAWILLLYSLFVMVFALSNHFGSPQYIGITWNLNETFLGIDAAFRPSEFALDTARCPALTDGQSEFGSTQQSTIVNECIALTTLNVICLTILGAFTFFSFVALMLFASDLEKGHTRHLWVH
jgi:hypothetical protein